MFKQARINLTIWYLVIIFGISLLFSLFIYSSTVFSTRRALQQPTDRTEMHLRQKNPPLFENEAFQNIRRDLRNTLIKVNIVILGISGLLGYFLAGKTLKPIENTLNDQKRFISDAAHELKTPITVLKTELEVILRDKKLTKDEAIAALKSNLEETNKLQGLAESLLKESVYTSNMVKNDVKLKQLVEKSVSTYEKRADIKSSLKDITIKANSTAIEELLSIFIDNAIKYSQTRSKISLSVKEKGKYAVLSIKDNGIGIRETDIPHIFNRFYRADNSRTKLGANGYGLGLSIAKNIVDSHKGKIEVESKIGKGTTFKIYLPLV